MLLRIGILSDIHGNLEALESVLKAVQQEAVDRIICLGDLVGYGPNPNECVQATTAVSDVILAGNHDHAAIDRLSTDCFNEYARKAIDWTRQQLTTDAKQLLEALPLIVREDRFTLVHATPEAPEAWNYLFGYTDALQCFEAIDTPVCFVGHSHVPTVYAKNKGAIVVQDAAEVQFEEGKTYIINVGSVGQPRDGNPNAAFGIFDDEKGLFNLMRCTYPVQTVQEKMQKYGLPPYLIDRLAYGH